MNVPMFTAPNMLVYPKPHITKEVTTIVASNPILIVENLQSVTIAIDSTQPSPGSGAILAGIYMNIPKAVRKILTIKNNAHIKTDPSKGINPTRYNAKSVKYPKSTQLISCSNLFL